MDVVTVGGEGRIGFYAIGPCGALQNIGTLAQLPHIPLHAELIHTATQSGFTSDLSVTVTGTRHPLLGANLLNAGTGERLYAVDNAFKSLVYCALTQDGEIFATTNPLGIFFFQTRPAFDLMNHVGCLGAKHRFTACSFSPDGRFLLVSREYAPLILIDVEYMRLHPRKEDADAEDADADEEEEEEEEEGADENKKGDEKETEANTKTGNEEANEETGEEGEEDPWDEEEKRYVREFGSKGTRYWAISFSSDGSKIAASTSTRHILIYDSATLTLLHDIRTFVSWCARLSPSADSVLGIAKASSPPTLYYPGVPIMEPPPTATEEDEEGINKESRQRQKETECKHISFTLKQEKTRESNPWGDQYAEGFFTSDGTRLVTVVTAMPDLRHVVVWDVATREPLTVTKMPGTVSSLHVTRVRYVIDWPRARLVLLGHLKEEKDGCPFAWTPALVIRQILSYIVTLPTFVTEAEEPERTEEEEEEAEEGPKRKRVKREDNIRWEFKTVLSMTGMDDDDENKDSEDDASDSDVSETEMAELKSKDPSECNTM